MAVAEALRERTHKCGSFHTKLHQTAAHSNDSNETDSRQIDNRQQQVCAMLESKTTGYNLDAHTDLMFFYAHD